MIYLYFCSNFCFKEIKVHSVNQNDRRIGVPYPHHNYVTTLPKEQLLEKLIRCLRPTQKLVANFIDLGK